MPIQLHIHIINIGSGCGSKLLLYVSFTLAASEYAYSTSLLED